VLHAAFVNSENPPPVLLLNAATSLIALMGLVTFGPVLNSFVPLPPTLRAKEDGKSNLESTTDIITAGAELGLWKTLGTTANLFGLSLTSSNHAAFLIQLTTLIVPTVQGVMGVPIPNRIWSAIALALAGIALFTQDASTVVSAAAATASDPAVSSSAESAAETIANSGMLQGDILCIIAAGFYATYDLRLFNYGKKVPPLPLIRTKIAVQAMLSCLLLAFLGEGGLNEAANYIGTLISSASSSPDAALIGSAALWSGLAINAIAPFLQVSGQQAVGASRAQVVYASQPLWASILSFILLHETLGQNGMIGGALFLTAIFLSASAENPDPNCGVDNCEV
jgi:drug/metabolite transporter (DMT)-like permease